MNMERERWIKAREDDEGRRRLIKIVEDSRGRSALEVSKAAKELLNDQNRNRLNDETLICVIDNSDTGQEAKERAVRTRLERKEPLAPEEVEIIIRNPSIGQELKDESLDQILKGKQPVKVSSLTRWFFMIHGQKRGEIGKRILEQDPRLKEVDREAAYNFLMGGPPSEQAGVFWEKKLRPEINKIPDEDLEDILSSTESQKIKKEIESELKKRRLWKKITIVKSRLPGARTLLGKRKQKIPAK